MQCKILFLIWKNLTYIYFLHTRVLLGSYQKHAYHCANIPDAFKCIVQPSICHFYQDLSTRFFILTSKDSHHMHHNCTTILLQICTRYTCRKTKQLGPVIKQRHTISFITDKLQSVFITLLMPVSRYQVICMYLTYFLLLTRKK